MQIKFKNEQTIDSNGILAIKQQEASTVEVRYAKHSIFLKGVTVSEVMQRVTLAKADSPDTR